MAAGLFFIGITIVFGLFAAYDRYLEHIEYMAQLQMAGKQIDDEEEVEDDAGYDDE